MHKPSKTEALGHTGRCWQSLICSSSEFALPHFWAQMVYDLSPPPQSFDFILSLAVFQNGADEC